MKIFNKLAMVAAGVVAGFGVMPAEAQASSFNQFINLDAKLNSESNAISVNLSAGTYSVDYIGINEGGVYDGWNAWQGVVGDCSSDGEGCRRGWRNDYSISFDDFSQLFATTGVYATPLQALQNAVNISFTLASATTVNFFIGDNYYEDNVGGVSLRLSSDNISTPKTVPETASILGLLAVGAIGLSTLKAKKQIV